MDTDVQRGPPGDRDPEFSEKWKFNTIRKEGKSWLTVVYQTLATNPRILAEEFINSAKNAGLTSAKEIGGLGIAIHAAK
jgi:hypothetical protein